MQKNKAQEMIRTVNIIKAPSTTIIDCPSSIFYTGEAITPCTATVTGAGLTDAKASITYTLNTNVGTASATATYSDKNHLESSDTKTFIINVNPVIPSTVIETIENKDGTESGTIPTETSFTMNIPSVGNVGVVIPEDITITGPAGWNGTISAPTITNVTLPTVVGETRTLTSAIELGFSGTKLTFDKAVKITMPGQAGKRVGYTRAGEPFTEITNVCGANTQAWADTNISANSECKIDAGADLVIWTKHFTTFASYTQTVNPSSGGGSYTPVVVNNTKDEGCLSGNLFSVTTGKSCPKITATTTNISTSNTQNIGQVLGAEKYNFTKL